MAKYRSVPVEVEAVQYRTGVEVPGMLLCKVVGCPRRGSPIVDDAHVDDGAWIVTVADGTRSIVSAEDFPRLYERVDAPEPRAVVLVDDSGATVTAWCDPPAADTVRVHRNGGSLLYDLATGRPVGRDSGPWRIVAEDLAALRRAVV